jgi:Family of unknown function (DUF5995)
VTPSVDSSRAERLEALARRLESRARALEKRKDSRCVFTHAYALLTHRLAEALPAAGLEDPGWVVDLAEAFADRYFSVLEAYDRGAELPPAWRAVFETICAGRTSVVEDLVFGVYVHIVRDLPHTLVELGLEDDEGRSHLRDHHALSALVGNAIDGVQDAVAERYGPYIRWLDRIGMRNDEILSDYGIRLSRGMAWYNALRLVDPRAAHAAAASLERSAQTFVAQIMNPPLWSLRTALRALRWLAAHLRRWPSSRSGSAAS